MAAIVYNNIPFDENDLKDHDTNFTLGQFMTAWSQAESTCGFLFRHLSKIEHEIANIIFDRIGAHEQFKILVELVEKLPDSEYRNTASTALAEIAEISIARNRIVHAGWGLFNKEKARFWHGITQVRFSEIMNETPAGKSARAKYIFTLSDITQVTKRTISAQTALQSALIEIASEQPRAHRAQAVDRRSFRPDMGPKPQ